MRFLLRFLLGTRAPISCNLLAICDFVRVSMKLDKMNRDFVSEHVHSCHKQGCYLFRDKIEISGDIILKSRTNRTKIAAS